MAREGGRIREKRRVREGEMEGGWERGMVRGRERRGREMES